MFIFANSPRYGTNWVTTSPGWNWSRSRHFCVLVWNLVYFLSKFKMVFDHNKDSEVFVPFFIVDNTISSKKRFLRACHSWSIRSWAATCSNHWSHARRGAWLIGWWVLRMPKRQLAPDFQCNEVRISAYLSCVMHIRLISRILLTCWIVPF